MRDPIARLRVLVFRIEKWEDEPEPKMTKEFIERVRDDEELLLDIKQCLESICETGSLTPTPR